MSNDDGRCSCRACLMTHDPSLYELNRVARLLIDEWERVERKPVNVSYITTFVDMARVVIADRLAPPQELPGVCHRVAAAVDGS